MKGNKAVRMVSTMILIALALAHFSGQVNLTQPTWQWLAAFLGFMAFQATVTRVCPARKMPGDGKKSGACCGG